MATLVALPILFKLKSLLLGYILKQKEGKRGEQENERNANGRGREDKREGEKIRRRMKKEDKRKIASGI